MADVFGVIIGVIIAFVLALPVLVVMAMFLGGAYLVANAYLDRDRKDSSKKF